ncbi:MAG: magnesium/cobalt transporter CorA [Anaerolineae bacterium]|nr:magnesium/cobalt transporter CorA [Anaerolineae bacterium]
MMRSLYLSRDGVTLRELSIEQIEAALRDDGGTLWVDCENEPPEDCQLLLEKVFGFHPLAVDDALRESHVPKIDDWYRYLYIVLHAVAFDRVGGEHLDTLELDLFLGPGYLVTHHDEPISAVEHVWAALERDPQRLRSGVLYLTYRLVDDLVASYMPAVEAIEDVIEALEDEMFSNPEPHMLERIFVLKRSLLRLRRVLAPQREVLNHMARDDYAVIDSNSRVFFRDIYDHLVRLYDIGENLRDLVNGAIEIYLSAVNNRMNETMKTLTIITTLFMPISFLTGFFGMNFFQPVLDLDVWTGRVAFGLALAAIAFTPVGMYLWMRRRAWM